MFLKLKHNFRVFSSRIREKKKEKQRSSEWAEVRDNFLLLHPNCAACGGTEKLQVHHIVPFHVDEKLELDENNLITLCMGKNECHLEIGHGDSWRCYNPKVEDDAENFFKNPNHREFLTEEIKSRRIQMSKKKSKKNSNI
jgi:5-methylcytosine-specific restriction protein A